MILTCASCATRYFADDGSIGPEGRSVRCAACGHTWHVAGALILDKEAGPASATFVDDPPPTITREQVEHFRAPSAAARARAKQAERLKKERLRTAAYAWGATGAALAVSLGLAIGLRQDIARAWPNAASAYAMVGLPVNITGLEFVDIGVERQFNGPTPSLVVSGAVRNIGSTNKRPPALRFSLRDANSDEIHHWIIELSGPPITPGGARPFRSALDSPPAGAVDLEATFASTGEVAAERLAPIPAPRIAPAPAAAPAGAEPHSETDASAGLELRRSPTGGPVEALSPLTPGPGSTGPIEGLAPRLPAGG